MSATNGVHAALDWATNRSKTKLARNTRAGYEQMYDRVMREGRTPGSAENPRTRQVERAAARYILAQEILLAHEEDDTKKIQMLWQQALDIQLIADKNSEAYADGSWQGKKHRRNSKKASLRQFVNACLEVHQSLRAEMHQFKTCF